MKYTILLGIFWGLLSLTGCNETELQQDVTPTVGFADTLIEVFENAGTQTLNVVLSSPATADMNVEIRIKSETNVKEGVDYVLGSREVHFAKGAVSASVQVDLTDDRLVNQSREFMLELNPGKGIRNDAAKGICRIVIFDDESEAALVFNQNQVNFMESDSTYYLPLDLEGTPSGVVKVIIETIDSSAREGVHYRVESKELMVEPGFKGIPVTLIDDDVINADRIFFVRIVSILGAKKITAKSICTVVIRNDDLGLYMGLNQCSVEERPANNISVKVPVRLVGVPTKDLEIQVAAVEGYGNAIVGRDFEIVNNGNLTIPYGQDSIEVEIRPLYESTITGEKNFRLQVTKVLEHDEIDLEGQFCDVIIYDYDTQVSFGSMEYTLGMNVTSLNIPITLSQAVYHNIQLKIDQPQSVTASGIEIENDMLTIPAGVTDTVLTVMLTGTLPADYELNLSAISGIEEVHNTPQNCQVITKNINSLSKSDWSIDSFTSEEEKNDGPATAAKLIDGDDKTFWHSHWSGYKDNGPFDIVVDLKKLTGISGVRCVRRIYPSPNSDTKRVSFHLSVGEDKNTWNKLGEKAYGSTAGGEVSLAVEQYYPTGRYFKVRVEECTSNNVASLGELYLEGFQED